jgi:negative regulator of flagellin synthesis FlgM
MKVDDVGASNKVNRIYAIYNSNTKKIDNFPAKDRIEISNAGKMLSSLCSNFDMGNNDSKVEAIKSQVKNGTYDRNSKLVAQKIVDYFKGREV